MYKTHHTPEPRIVDLARRRAALGLSRSLVATLANVSQGLLTRVEYGTGRTLRADEMARLAYVIASVEGVRTQAAQMAAGAA
jgi:predicted transcriptional regulator